MATIVKTPSGTWKAVIRKLGWPTTTAKTFRTKRDAEDWARRTEDEMVSAVFTYRVRRPNATSAWPPAGRTTPFALSWRCLDTYSG
jgi:hypothetical protein